MTRNEKLTALLLTAAAAWAVYEIISMPDAERETLCRNTKKTISTFLDDPDNAPPEINSLLGKYQSGEEIDWIEVLYLLRKTYKKIAAEDYLTTAP
ncbi:MAG TPA: hypothetical protein PLM81_02415 [Ginsengibacter sp.]|nr:hypothetical protein [Ginsengibacter sp.]HRP17186.1 hypothetical protein [Ginsengibacter sp.]HRP43860.1 hypothetical protein [Ginsengibacter sp.]